jgi:hypothetical protein
MEVCPVSCIMLDPQRHESRGELMEKYQQLMASA